MVNACLRAARLHDARSQKALHALVYAQLSREYRGLSSYVVCAMRDALAILKAHRRRLKRRPNAAFPWVRRLFLKVDPSRFHLDPETGGVRLSIGNGSWVAFPVALSDWHRAQLASGKVGQAVLREDRLVVTLTRRAPRPYVPRAVLALDTNEGSLDGALAGADGASLVTIPLGDVRAVQARHFERRRRLARKKAHDRRVKRRLLGREGARESNRVRSRLHLVSNAVVRAAKEQQAAIALEDLTGIRRFFSPRLNRRLSAWPHRELHRQVAYKALAAGVPLVHVDPRNTSKTCPRCDAIPKRRAGEAVFVCARCGWSLDRQLNAGLNILNRAVRGHPEALGGLWFDLDALRKDAVKPLYAPASRAARAERSARSPVRAMAVSDSRTAARHGVADAATR